MINRIIQGGARVICTFIMALVFFDSAEAVDDEAPKISSKKIAVLNFSTNNAPEFLSRVVRNVMEVTIFATGELQLLEWEQIQNILRGSKWEEKGDLDVTDSIELGQKLKTDFLVVGSIDKIEDYRITARVIAVSEKKILMAYSKKFSSANDIDDVTEKMAQDLNRDIGRYVRTGYLRRRFYDTYSIIFGVSGECVLPFGSFRNLVNTGYGFSAAAGVENLFRENFYLGVAAGFHRFTGRDSSSDTLTIVPLGLDIGYRIQLHRRIFMQPVITPGVVFLTMKHGTDAGFDMAPDSEKSYSEPMLSAGGSIGLYPIQTLRIMFTARYGVIYEPAGLLHYLSFGLGFFYSF